MSVLDFAEFSAFLPENHQKKIAKQWNKVAATAKLLEFRPAAGGLNCSFIADVGGKSSRAFADGYAVQQAEFDSNTRLVASVSWAQYRSPFSLTRRTITAGKFARGTASEIENILADEVVNANAELLSKINQDLHAGPGTSDRIFGLNSALVTSGSPYGINVATHTAFASNVETSVGALTAQKLAEMEEAIYTRSGHRPDVIVMAPDVMTKLSHSGVILDNRRYTDGSKMDLGVAPDSMSFQGIPCLRDKDMASGTLKFLNLDSMHVEVMLDLDADKDAVVLLSAPGVSAAGEAVEAAGLPLILYSLAKDGPSQKYSLDTPSLQLVVTHPNRNGVMTGITV